MMFSSTAIECRLYLSLAASLIGAAMLIGSVQPSRAGETTAAPVSVERQAPDRGPLGRAGQTRPGSAGTRHTAAILRGRWPRLGLRGLRRC